MLTEKKREAGSSPLTCGSPMLSAFACGMEEDDTGNGQSAYTISYCITVDGFTNLESASR